MPRRFKVLALPARLVAQLDARLRESAFSAFDAHSAWLGKVGHPIGKSALHVYATQHRERIQAGRSLTLLQTTPTDPVKLADQRIACLTVAASLRLEDDAKPADIKAAANDLLRWAYRP